MSRKINVSIVLPSKNGERYLSESISSIVSQTFRDWELIIVNDASCDRTEQIATEWANIDSRIQVVNIKQNQKLPGALNAGFELAQGTWHTWTSDDNEYHSTALADLLYEVNKNAAICAYAGWDIVNDLGIVVGRQDPMSAEWLIAYNVVGPCFLYHSKLFKMMGGYSTGSFLAEDYDFWIRIPNHGKIVSIPTRLYNYRVHSNSLTAKYRREIQEATERVFKSRLFLDGRPVSAELSRKLLDIADDAIRQRQTGIARTALLRSLMASNGIQMNSRILRLYIRSLCVSLRNRIRTAVH